MQSAGLAVNVDFGKKDPLLAGRVIRETTVVPGCTGIGDHLDLATGSGRVFLVGRALGPGKGENRQEHKKKIPSEWNKRSHHAESLFDLPENQLTRCQAEVLLTSTFLYLFTY
jgi:hypothetical protein